MIIPDSMKTALTYDEFDAAYKILPKNQKEELERFYLCYCEQVNPIGMPTKHYGMVFIGEDALDDPLVEADYIGYHIHLAAKLASAEDNQAAMRYIAKQMRVSSAPIYRVFYLTLLSPKTYNFRRRSELADDVLFNKQAHDDLKQHVIDLMLDWAISCHQKDFLNEIYEKYKDYASTLSLPLILAKYMVGEIDLNKLEEAIKKLNNHSSNDETEEAGKTILENQTSSILEILKAIKNDDWRSMDIHSDILMNEWGLDKPWDRSIGSSSVEAIYITAMEAGAQGNIRWNVLGALLFKPGYVQYGGLKATIDKFSTLAVIPRMMIIKWFLDIQECKDLNSTLIAQSTLLEVIDKHNRDEERLPFCQSSSVEIIKEAARAYISKVKSPALLKNTVTAVVMAAENGYSWKDLFKFSEPILNAIKGNEEFAEVIYKVFDSADDYEPVLIMCVQHFLNILDYDKLTAMANSMNSSADPHCVAVADYIRVVAVYYQNNIEGMEYVLEHKSEILDRTEGKGFGQRCVEILDLCEGVLEAHNAEQASNRLPDSVSRNIHELSPVAIEKLPIGYLMFLSAFYQEAVDPLSGKPEPIGWLEKPILPGSMDRDYVMQMLEEGLAASYGGYEGRDLDHLRIMPAIEPIGDVIAQAAAVESRLNELEATHPDTLEKTVKIVLREEICEYILAGLKKFDIDDVPKVQLLRQTATISLMHLRIDDAEKVIRSAIHKSVVNAREQGYHSIFSKDIMRLIQNYCKSAAKNNWNMAQSTRLDNAAPKSYVRDFICGRGWDRSLVNDETVGEDTD
jgi:hypothetical protein